MRQYLLPLMLVAACSGAPKRDHNSLENTIVEGYDLAVCLESSGMKEDDVLKKENAGRTRYNHFNDVVENTNCTNICEVAQTFEILDEKGQIDRGKPTTYLKTLQDDITMGARARISNQVIPSYFQAGIPKAEELGKVESKRALLAPSSWRQSTFNPQFYCATVSLIPQEGEEGNYLRQVFLTR